MTTYTTRKDPLDEVVDYTTLRIAAGYARNGQNEAYWNTVATPTRPDGTVAFEAARMVLTFALPLAVIAAAVLFGNTEQLVKAAAFAIALGVALHLHLVKSIAKKEAADRALDRGRFAATKVLSARLGLAPEEITLTRLYKMASDFVTVDSFLKAEAARIVKCRVAGRKFTLPASAQEDAGVAEALGMHQVSYARSANLRVATPVFPENYVAPAAPALAFNPVNGLPMVGDSGLDIHGNMMGTNSVDAFIHTGTNDVTAF